MHSVLVRRLPSPPASAGVTPFDHQLLTAFSQETAWGSDGCWPADSLQADELIKSDIELRRHRTAQTSNCACFLKWYSSMHNCLKWLLELWCGY